VSQSETSRKLDRSSGYLWVALAALLWAMSGTAAKFLFNNGMSAFQLIQLRTTLSFVGLLLWLAVFRRPLLAVAFRDVAYFCALGILGVAAAQFFYLFAISKINVAAAILLHYTGPVFVVLYLLTVKHERPTRRTVLAIFGSLLGCFLMVGAYRLDMLSMNMTGIAGGFLAALGFAVYSLLSEYGMRRYSHWTVLLYALLFAALLWNVLHPPLEAFFRPYSAAEWFWILFIAVVGTIMAFGSYFKGVLLIRASHASITATLEPISAGFIAFLFLGETMAPVRIFGGLLVVVSVVLLQTQRSATEAKG
jgi:drug/metabolite transporter (DMT)-like permease